MARLKPRPFKEIFMQPVLVYLLYCSPQPTWEANRLGPRFPRRECPWDFRQSAPASANLPKPAARRDSAA